MADTDTDRVISRPLIVAALSAFVVMAALSAWAYVRLPDDALVPLRWGIDGEVAAYAGKLQGLFITVALFPLVAGLLALVPRIEPRKVNLTRSARAFRATIYAVIVFFVALHVLIVVTAFGHAVDVNRVIPLAVGLLLVVVGNWLPKIRSNFLFGIRTPWTLTSDHTWRRTHRAGGWAFVALGLGTIVMSLLLPTTALLAVIGGGAALITVGAFAYSYAVWRTAPDRTARNGAR
jgi:uncharacterized membrane protein